MTKFFLLKLLKILKIVILNFYPKKTNVKIDYYCPVSIYIFVIVILSFFRKFVAWF